MIVFLLEIIAIIFILTFSVNKKSLSLKAKYYLTSFFLIIVLGCRGISVGVDTYAYYDLYDLINSASDYSEIEWLEPGFILSSRLAGYFDLSASLYILISAIVTILCFNYFIKSKSNDYALSILLFLTLGGYFFLFNALRQGLAASILVLSVPYIVNRNFFN